MLTNKYLTGIPDDSRIAKDNRFLHETDLTESRLLQIAALDRIAQKRGQTLAQMALSWILRDNGVCSVLIGASKPGQILENISVAENSSFTEEEFKEIDRICSQE